MPKTRTTYIRDLNIFPDRYTLASDSQDIRDTLENIGRADLQDGYGCLFVRTGDAEIIEVWGCTMSVPLLTHPVDRIL